MLMLGGRGEKKLREYVKVGKVKEMWGISCGGEGVEDMVES